MLSLITSLGDLRAIYAAIRAGNHYLAASLAAKLTPTKDDDRVVELLGRISQSDDPEQWFRDGLEILRIVAKHTPTEVDDKVLLLVDQVADSQVFEDLLAWIRSLYHGGPVPQFSPSGTYPIGCDDPEKAIPIPVIISIASLIVSLIRLLKDGEPK